MSINLEQLRELLKSVNKKTYRGNAPPGVSYPYIVYSNISMGKKIASGKTIKLMPLYQISLFTTGTESDLVKIRKKFNEYQISFRGFQSIQGDENDETVTNFYTYVRCVESVEQ